MVHTPFTTTTHDVSMTYQWDVTTNDDDASDGIVTHTLDKASVTFGQYTMTTSDVTQERHRTQAGVETKVDENITLRGNGLWGTVSFENTVEVTNTVIPGVTIIDNRTTIYNRTGRTGSFSGSSLGASLGGILSTGFAAGLEAATDVGQAIKDAVTEGGSLSDVATAAAGLLAPVTSFSQSFTQYTSKDQTTTHYERNTATRTDKSDYDTWTEHTEKSERQNRDYNVPALDLLFPTLSALSMLTMSTPDKEETTVTEPLCPEPR